MKNYNDLSDYLKKYLWNQGWSELNNIQQISIDKILDTTKHILISSDTASGKTEAAFLPILTDVDHVIDSSVCILYIAPLKSLINNLEIRLKKMTSDRGVIINSWHGDISNHQKQNFIKNPSGVLMITPESLEAFLVTKTENEITRVFGKIKYVVVDEFHAFMGEPRGYQLRSLFSRLQFYNTTRMRIIMLSATLSESDSVAEWLGTSKNLVVIRNEKKRELYTNVKTFGFNENNIIETDTLYDIWNLTKRNRSLIFCNSRKMVDQLFLSMTDIAKRNNSRTIYYHHHALVSSNERKAVELLLNNQTDQPVCVICTSTLELGVDIRDIDFVIQVGANLSVSSLRQRAGRAGREFGARQNVQLYIEPKDTLNTIAKIQLLNKGWVEPKVDLMFRADILIHQLIYFVAEHQGATHLDLWGFIKGTSIWNKIDEDELVVLVNELVVNHIFQKLKNKEYILGLEGEKLINRRSFYGVFSQADTFTVFSNKILIGYFSGRAELKDVIFLENKNWLVEKIDSHRKVINVSKTELPQTIFERKGIFADHEEIRRKAMCLRKGSAVPNYLDKQGKEVLLSFREDVNACEHLSEGLIIEEKKELVHLHIMMGMRKLNALYSILKAMDISFSLDWATGVFEFDKDMDVKQLLSKVKKNKWDSDELLQYVVGKKSDIVFYDKYLPQTFRDRLNSEILLDLKGLLVDLDQIFD